MTSVWQKLSGTYRIKWTEGIGGTVDASLEATVDRPQTTKER